MIFTWKFQFYCWRIIRANEGEDVEEEIEITKIHSIIKGIINNYMIWEDEEHKILKEKEKKNNGGRYDKSQIECYNCYKVGHFAWEHNCKIIEKQSNYVENNEKGEAKLALAYKVQEGGKHAQYLDEG